MSTAPKLSDVLEDAISRAARAVQRRAQTLRDPAGEAWSQDVEDFAEDIRGEIIGEVTKLHEFAERISKQKPEKPDHWNSCGQCERNISAAEDLLT